GVFFLLPRNPILPAEDQEITSPFLFVRDTTILLNDAETKASPTGSTLLTFFFLLLAVFPLAIVKTLYILVIFFLLATVFLRPLRVLELFFVFCPRTGKPER